MQLSDEDIVMIDDSLRHLCKDLAEAVFSRPERACEPEPFSQAMNLVMDQGFVNTDEESGCGLWEACGQAPQLALTLRSLTALARVNAALALSLHRSALAHFVLRQLGRTDMGTTHPGICLHGRHGIGRGELANWWRGQPMDEAVLRDVLAPDRPFSGLMHPQTQLLLAPAFTKGTMAWLLIQGQVKRAEPGHGLDELHDGAFEPAQVQVIALPEQQARALSMDVWHREWLGLLAIQQGCVQQMTEMAQQFSALRFQGGRVIAGHPAVQIMLSDMQMALTDVRTVLAGQALNEAGFADLLRARNRLNDGLALAANVAMQTFGGLGYMRDNGIEKRWRDVNHLRQQSGGALDMQLMSANWCSNTGATA